MTSPEQDNPVQERLTKLANVTGNAVLVLNSDITHNCLQNVRSSLANLDRQESLSLVLNSSGGSIEDAFLIAKAVRSHCERLDVLVPHRAKSAATLIALSADRILFGQFGELGPLDPQVIDVAGGSGRRSPLEIVKGLEFLRNYYIETLDTLILVLRRNARMDVAHALDHVSGLLSPIAEPLYSSVNYRELGEAARDLAISEEYAKETMRRWSLHDENTSEFIVRWLVWEYPDHSYIIDIEEATSIGLSNVEPLDSFRERLCLSVVEEHEPLVEIALPDYEDRTETGNDAIAAKGGQSGIESAATCEQ